MTQNKDAEKFASLHKKGDPLVLYNIWDAGSAKAVATAGARAIATGSHSVAAAQGFEDGEALPFDLLVVIVGNINQSISLPLTVDFEGGFAVAPDKIEENARRIIAAGAVGVNFEDQRVEGSGLYSINEQVDRIAAVKRAGDGEEAPLFINARTDLFLKESDPARHGALMGNAIERAEAYRDAGANSFFAPGLTDLNLIATLCEKAALPVNIMMKPDAPALNELAEVGVARISYGPFPFIEAMDALIDKARGIYR